MTYLLAGLLPTLFVGGILGFLLWRADRRYDETQKAWRLERVGLLNRISAPGVVPPEDAPEPSDEPIYVPMDDDEAYEKYREDRELGLVT